jgi:flagellar biosynthesis protein FlhG
MLKFFEAAVPPATKGAALHSQGGQQMTTIIPVAGGKGGVGKSLFTANLGIALAELGHAVIVADLDLGGSNLHSFLGLANDAPGIGDFLIARRGDLQDLLVPTATAGLRFLPGDGRTPLMASITHAQKSRLLRELRKLPARYLLLDLGAGSSLHTLDLFLMAPRGLVVTVPEMPAMMNAMAFLKNAVFRMISSEIGRREPLKKMVEASRSRPLEEQNLTMAELIGQIARVDAAAGSRLQQLCRQLTPRLIFNLGEEPDDLAVFAKMERSLRERLQLQTECFGFIYADPTARQAIRKGQPLLNWRRDSLAAQGIERIADRLVRLWDEPLPDSLERLLRDTRQHYRGAEKEAATG